MTDLLTDLEYIKEEDEEINMSKRETVPLEVTEDMFTCFYSISNNFLSRYSIEKKKMLDYIK